MHCTSSLLLCLSLSLSPAIFSCIMVPYLGLSELFMISSHWIICHVLSFILSIPFPVLLMSTFLLSQVLKYFFLAMELLPWLPSARPLLNSPASQQWKITVWRFRLLECPSALLYCPLLPLLFLLFHVCFGVKITILSSLFDSKIAALVSSVLGDLLINITSVACLNKKWFGSDAHFCIWGFAGLPSISDATNVLNMGISPVLPCLASACFHLIRNKQLGSVMYKYSTDRIIHCWAFL